MHWGPFVGSVARGMRQVGLPLGKHHHTQHLDPEGADAAAAARKQVGSRDQGLSHLMGMVSAGRSGGAQTGSGVRLPVACMPD